MGRAFRPICAFVRKDFRSAAGKDYLRAPLRKALAAIDREYPDLAAALEQVDLTEWR